MMSPFIEDPPELRVWTVNLKVVSEWALNYQHVNTDDCGKSSVFYASGMIML